MLLWMLADTKPGKSLITCSVISTSTSTNSCCRSGATVNTLIKVHRLLLAVIVDIFFYLLHMKKLLFALSLLLSRTGWPPRRRPALCSWRTDPIAQRPDAADFKLDNVAWLQLASQFKGAAEANRAGADQLTRVNPLGFGDIRDNLLYPPHQIRAGAARPLFAVHARDHTQVMDIHFIGSGNPGAKSGGKVFPFSRTQSAGALFALDIARAKVVVDRYAEKMRAGNIGREIIAVAPNHEAQLQFVVHILRVIGPRHLLFVADDAETIAFVIHWHLVVHIGDRALLPDEKSVTQVLLECQAIAHHRRIKRREPFDSVDGKDRIFDESGIQAGLRGFEKAGACPDGGAHAGRKKRRRKPLRRFGGRATAQEPVIFHRSQVEHLVALRQYRHQSRHCLIRSEG